MWHRSGDDRPKDPVQVASAADEMEAGILVSLLGSCGIRAVPRNRGIGAYMGVVLGSNRYGIDIYVDGTDAAAARAVLASRPAESGPVGEPEADGGADDPSEPQDVGSESDEEEEAWEEEGSPSARKRSSPWLFLALLLVVVAIALLVRLLSGS